MTFYYRGIRNDYFAIMEVNEAKYIVKKGSKVSITVSEHFRGSRTVLKRREEKRREAVGIQADRIVPCDIEFNSSSTAGEFIGGTSCNGPSCWKTKGGIKLKQVMEG